MNSLKRKKIGILTFHYANNYGAVLQTYALQQKLEQLGYSVEVIDYVEKNIENGYKIFHFSKGQSQIKSILKGFIRIWNKEWVKRKKFNVFRKKFITLSKECSQQEQLATLNYDTVIVGSDQVWNLELTNNNEIYFLNSIKDRKVNKISYAASFGKDQLNKEEIQFIMRHIIGLNYISVREESAKELLEQLGVRNVNCVLDPTLLINYSVWNKIMVSNTTKKFQSKLNAQIKYIFMYRMTYNKELVKTAYKLAKKEKLKIISLSMFDKPEHLSGIQHINGIGPLEFLNLIANAEYVLTDSFHGVAFSIVFHRQFFTIPHEIYGCRTINLLNKFGLSNRMLQSNKDLTKQNIEYNMVDTILKSEQKKAELFLERALYE